MLALGVAVPLLSATLALAAPATPPATTRGTPAIRSLSRLAFTPDGTLLVGDSQGAAVWALDLGDRTPPAASPDLTLERLDDKLAALLGTTPDDVLIHDMAVSPVSRNVYISASRGLQQSNRRFPIPSDTAEAKLLLRVDAAGQIAEVPLKDVTYSKAELPDAPAADAKLWVFKARSFTITDLAWAEGKVYVAGLSNQEFASTLRVFDYPFTGAQNKTTLEIYHAAHGKYETEAPIETFLPYRIGDRTVLLASYTCTPLALFSQADLKPGAHVRGTTLGEFGAGNMPLDMVAYKRDGKDYVLLANSLRALMSIAAEDIAKQTSGLTQPVEDYGTAGVHFRALPHVGVQQLDRLSDTQMLVLLRSVRDGKLSLQTLPTTRL
jgi:hypothetical protein